MLRQAHWLRSFRADVFVRTSVFGDEPDESISAAKNVTTCGCPWPAGAGSAAPPPGDGWLGPLLVVGFPVLAQQWDELFCVFVGEVHSSALDRVEGNCGGDEIGEPMRPFGSEQQVVAGAPDNEGRRCEGGQAGSDRG